MSDELVKRLREIGMFSFGWTANQAADRIEALTSERDRLREALTRLLAPFENDSCRYDHHGYCQEHFIEADCCVSYARAALKGATP